MLFQSGKSQLNCQKFFFYVVFFIFCLLEYTQWMYLLISCIPAYDFSSITSNCMWLCALINLWSPFRRWFSIQNNQLVYQKKFKVCQVTCFSLTTLKYASVSLPAQISLRVFLARCFSLKNCKRLFCVQCTTAMCEEVFCVVWNKMHEFWERSTQIYSPYDVKYNFICKCVRFFPLCSSSFPRDLVSLSGILLVHIAKIRKGRKTVVGDSLILYVQLASLFPPSGNRMLLLVLYIDFSLNFLGQIGTQIGDQSITK